MGKSRYIKRHEAMAGVVQVLVMLGVALRCGLAQDTANQPVREVVTITAPNGGPWGDWGPTEFCPEGSYATGFEIKVEEPQRVRRGDDTAMNGIKLYCRSAADDTETAQITSTVYKWGDWLGVHNCRSTYLNAFQLRVETPQRTRVINDDTAANDMNMKCIDEELLEGHGGHWGVWSGWQTCPEGRAICGLQTKVEGEDNDETALNSVIFYCCIVE